MADVDETIAEGEVKPAEQDAEYLAPAHAIIEGAINELEPGIGHDWATWILDKLADAGWHLLTAEDAEKMLGAYVLDRLRSGDFGPEDS